MLLIRCLIDLTLTMADNSPVITCHVSPTFQLDAADSVRARPSTVNGIQPFKNPSTDDCGMEAV